MDKARFQALLQYRPKAEDQRWLAEDFDPDEEIMIAYECEAALDALNWERGVYDGTCEHSPFEIDPSDLDQISLLYVKRATLAMACDWCTVKLEEAGVDLKACYDSVGAKTTFWTRAKELRQKCKGEVAARLEEEAKAHRWGQPKTDKAST